MATEKKFTILFALSFASWYNNDATQFNISSQQAYFWKKCMLSCHILLRNELCRNRTKLRFSVRGFGCALFYWEAEMGFRFRKSINLGGGFRVNLSKSGVGYSWGTKGFRITKTAKGTTRTTVGIPGSGISYVTETGKKKTKERFSAGRKQRCANGILDSNPDNGDNKERGRSMAWMDFIICLLFGYLGVHKFKEKKIGMGLLYLCTIGLFGVGWIYDCVRYLIAAIQSSKKNSEAYPVRNEMDQNNSPPSSVEPSAIINIVKKVGAWCLTLFFAMGAMVYLPKLAGFLAIGVVLLVLPIKKWKYYLDRYVQGRIKVIAVVVLAILTFSTAPVPVNVEEADPVGTSVTEAAYTADSLKAEDEGNTEPMTEVPTTQHEHDFSPATCIEPKKCTTCGATEGSAAGHSWEDATCINPKTCSVCGAKEGDVAEHSWKDATCMNPKTCSVCGAEEGDVAEHSWEDATCLNSKTCSVCGATEGNASGHTWVDATCSSPKTCAECGETEGDAAEHHYVSGICVSCGGNDPDYVSETMVWIPTNGGTKYHTHAGCSNMKDPIQVTKSEAIARGFTPCKRCY